jgi:aminoglycoside phosphotransferase (APT) family kinase protein
LLDDVSFRLYGQARNTIYRVSSRCNWFLKMPRSGDASSMERERIGAETMREVFRDQPDYEGAAVIRVSAEPAFVLAATIPGKPLNTFVFTQCWVPGAHAAQRLERTFLTLGSLLASLHRRGRVEPRIPAATTRPFQALASLLDRSRDTDEITDAIATWHHRGGRLDAGETFLHGNFRLDNILRIDGRLGFLDFENCGTGSSYQDLSRPVSELLLTRCVAPFPHARANRWLRAFLDAYSRGHAYDPALLGPYVGARLARYYLESRRSGGVLPKTIGGLPVIAGRLNRLVLDALRQPIEQLAPEISPN